MFTFRSGTNDKEVYDCVVEFNEYRITKFNPGDIVLDIGMHIGSFCKKAHDAGSRNVYGYEADIENFLCAYNNMKDIVDNGKGIYISQYAVTRSDSVPEFLFFAGYEKWPDKYNTGGGSVLWSTSGQRVPCIGFDQIIDSVTNNGKKRVRFVKLDCEESEFPILLTSNRLGLIDEIAMEFHEIGGEFDKREIPPTHQVDGFTKFTGEVLADYLTECGFTCEVYGPTDCHLGKMFCKRK